MLPDPTGVRSPKLEGYFLIPNAGGRGGRPLSRDASSGVIGMGRDMVEAEDAVSRAPSRYLEREEDRWVLVFVPDPVPSRVGTSSSGILKVNENPLPTLLVLALPLAPTTLSLVERFVHEVGGIDGLALTALRGVSSSSTSCRIL